MNKERAKANLIRSAKYDEVIYTQGIIDGIHFVMGEPDRVISTTDPSSSESDN